MDPTTLDLRSKSGLARELNVLLNTISYTHDVALMLVSILTSKTLDDDVKKALYLSVATLFQVLDWCDERAVDAKYMNTFNSFNNKRAAALLDIN